MSNTNTYTYKFFNITTNHTLHQSNNLKEITTFYHKVPRRKHSTLLLINTITGEVLKIKSPKNT